MIYGYARCSTNEERQDIDRQKWELHSLGVTDDKYIYWEYESGTKDDRAKLLKLMDIVSEGDTILWTCRAGEALEESVFRCRNQQLTFDAVNGNIPEIVKPYENNSKKLPATST